MSRLRPVAFTAIASFCGFLSAIAACGDSDTGTEATGTGGAGGAGPSTTAPSVSSSSSASSGSGVGGAWTPTPPDTQYHAVAAIPAGEVIVFSDWNSPSSINTMPPGGGQKTTIFEANLVWSFGVAPKSRRIAFSSGFTSDVQKEHYGTDVGNAIEPTWLYDPTTQEISLLTSGNLNDECHLFGPDEKTLYLCRRYDFDEQGMNKGYRVGSIDLATSAFTFLTADLASELDLYPAVNADETKLLFAAAITANGMQTREIKTEALPPAAPTKLVDDGDAPVFSPDFSLFVYKDYGAMGALTVANADGSMPVKIATEGGDSAVWSPDGSHVAFLVYDNAANCSHVDVVKSDGSEADAPTRIRDCTITKEFISGLAWLAP
jgi:hypothetical protein